MLALNLPYMTCPTFEFDQDLFSEELPFKFKNKKDKGVPGVLFDQDSDYDYDL